MAIAIVLLLFAAMAVLVVLNPRRSLLVAVWLIPWTGLYVDIGLQVSAYQLVLAPLLLVTILRLAQPGLRPLPVAAGGLLALFLLYVVIASLLQIGYLPGLRIEGGGLRGPTARAAVQIIMFLFGISPALLVPVILRTGTDIIALGRTYVQSVLALAVIGWGQMLVWFGSGNNPLPIGIVNVWAGGSNAEGRVGSFGFGDLAIYRMNSLALEPRNLGVALVFALLLIQAQALTAPRPGGVRLFLAWALLLVSVLATFSTSAILLWLVGTAILLPACWLFNVPVRRSPAGITAAVAAVIMPVLLGIAAAEASGIPVIDILAERTIERLGSDGAVEDFDLAILGYLNVHPEAAVTGTGLGNIHLYAGPYLDPLFAMYAENNVFVAKTQYLRFISEIGIIGLLLFFAWYLRLLRLAARAARPDVRIAPVVPMAAVAVTMFMASNQLAAEVYMLAGSLAVIHALAAPARPRNAVVSAALTGAA